MIRPIVSTDEWCAAYDLQPEEHKCESCGEVLQIDVPIAIKNYRGLTTSSHECFKEGCNPTILMPIGKKKYLWSLIK